MRRPLMFLVLVVCCFGQIDIYHTKGEINGLFWGKLGSDSKVVFLEGVQVGNRLVPAWLLSDLPPTCSAPFQQYPKMSNGVLLKELDMFYSNPANVPFPIGVAVTYTFLKLMGSSKESLEEFRTKAIQVYSK